DAKVQNIDQIVVLEIATTQVVGVSRDPVKISAIMRAFDNQMPRIGRMQRAPQRVQFIFDADARVRTTRDAHELVIGINVCCRKTAICAGAPNEPQLRADGTTSAIIEIKRDGAGHHTAGGRRVLQPRPHPNLVQTADAYIECGRGSVGATVYCDSSYM